MTDTSWYPDNYYTDPLPHYETMPTYLRVEDTFASTLDGGAQKFWRSQRTSGLAQWEPVGFEIRIRERPPDFGYRNHRVTLAINDNQYNYPAHGCFGCTPPGQGDKDDTCPRCARRGIGWVSIDDDVWRNAWLGRNGQYLRYLVAHEFGHCLGFTHGGTGIMDATPYHAQVNPEEITAAKAYWGINELSVNSTSTITNSVERILRVLQRARIEKSIEYAGVFSCRRISGSTTFSQHAWGNATDLFPTENEYGPARAQCMAIANAVVWQARHRTAANNRRKLDVAEVIDHENGRIWTPSGGWGPYGGNPGLHVHVSGDPKRTGTPECA